LLFFGSWLNTFNTLMLLLKLDCYLCAHLDSIWSSFYSFGLYYLSNH
jgi:hypothetical protein